VFSLKVGLVINQSQDNGLLTWIQSVHMARGEISIDWRCLTLFKTYIYSSPSKITHKAKRKLRLGTGHNKKPQKENIATEISYVGGHAGPECAAQGSFESLINAYEVTHSIANPI
jgi:hypothetical protein